MLRRINELWRLLKGQSPDAAESCAYQKLPAKGKCIRILILEPGSFDSAIQCRLRIASLGKWYVRYSALSYVWGDKSSVPGRIYLHGVEHEVTPNLESALRHLRYEDRARHLWVDAVCINQDDLDERAAQVRMMADIFKHADTTLSWLGEATKDSDEAMDLIQSLGSWLGEHEDEIFGDDSFLDPPSAIPDRIAQMGFPLERQNWAALWSLLHRPYWTRIWIIQELAARGEVALASGSLHCGHKNVKRLVFDMCCTLLIFLVRDLDLLRDANSIVSGLVRSVAMGGHPPGLSMVQTLIFTGRFKAPRSHLDVLLRRTAHYKATDPRDKLYALRGMASDGDLVEPDYTKALAPMLKDFCRSHIARHHSLCLLHGNRYRMNPIGPSWIPDILLDELHDNRWLKPTEELFAAAGTCPASVSFDENLDVLSALGVMVGKIDRVIGPFSVPEEKLKFEVEQGLLNAFEGSDLGQCFLDIDAYGHSLSVPADKETLWRTLCLNGDWSSLEPSFPAPDSFAAQFGAMLLDQPLPANFKPELPEESRHGEFIRPFQASLNAVMNDRVFFTTADGRMGTGPYLAQPGDAVVILFGASLCFVLRPVEKQYKLVGDAYMHGVMDGELVKDVDAASVETFDII